MKEVLKMFTSKYLTKKFKKQWKKPAVTTITTRELKEYIKVAAWSDEGFCWGGVAR